MNDGLKLLLIFGAGYAVSQYKQKKDTVAWIKQNMPYVPFTDAELMKKKRQDLIVTIASYGCTVQPEGATLPINSLQLNKH